MTSSRKLGATPEGGYQLAFNASAKKEWDKLNSTIRLQFASKLKQRLDNPHVEADKLRDMPGCYKIKLRSLGYRLVYEVRDRELIVTVVAVGKREKGRVYRAAKGRQT